MAKGKLSPKEKRAAEQQRLKEARLEKANKKKEESLPTNTVSENKAVEENTNDKKRKSIAKASGLKSVIAVNDSIIMTSFGKGNSAVIEKKICDNSFENINNDKPAFEIIDFNDEISQKKIKIKSSRIDKTAVADRPDYISPEKETVYNNVRDDMLHCKSKLEERYFDKTFNDNLHIQIIYNILDIEKIMAAHIANIRFALNNLMRETEEDDLIGYISSQDNYDEFCKKFKNNKKK